MKEERIAEIKEQIHITEFKINETIKNLFLAMQVGNIKERNYWMDEEHRLHSILRGLEDMLNDD